MCGWARPKPQGAEDQAKFVPDPHKDRAWTVGGSGQGEAQVRKRPR